MTMTETESKPTTMSDIDSLAAKYAGRRAQLADRLNQMQAALEAVKKEALREIKELAQRAGQSEAELRLLIELAPDLFKKPRTFTLHGIKVGFTHAAGRIVFDDGETVIKLIRRHFKDIADTLIRTKEEVNKDGLKTIAEADLYKIACKIEGRGDRVVVQSTDDEIEKMLAKLINQMVETVMDQSEAA